jgi:hypothetical protein
MQATMPTWSRPATAGVVVRFAILLRNITLYLSAKINDLIALPLQHQKRAQDAPARTGRRTGRVAPRSSMSAATNDKMAIK